MSIHFRYTCTLENTYVWEERDETLGEPTVCVNDGAAIVAGSITVVEEPHLADDIDVEGELDMTNATVEGLSHASLDDGGIHTHAEIDSHIDNTSIHRAINDSSVASDALWSANKITSQLATKSNASHTHTSSQITNFSSAVSTQSNVSANSAHRANTTTNPHGVTKTQVGLSNVENVKVNLTATTAPTTANNTSQGYSVGSRWIDTVLKKEHVCLTATALTATWTETTQQTLGGGGGGWFPVYIFHAYDKGGSTNLTYGYTAVPWDTVELSDAIYSHVNNSSDITVNANGWFRIEVEMSTEVLYNSSRTTSVARIMRDSGKGFEEVSGSRAHFYNRQNKSGQTSAAFSRTIQLAAGDKIRVEASRDSGGGYIYTIANSCRINIENKKEVTII